LGNKIHSKAIILIGYRGSGKTSVGERVAAELDRPFFDTDALVEKQARMPIEAIVSKMGWTHFREREKQVIESVSGKPNRVIATGGGAVMDPANVVYLKRNGWIFWLRAEAQILRQRIAKDQDAGKDRPSLTGTDPLKEIQAVLAQRDPVYQQICDFVIDTEGYSVRDVAVRILNGLGDARQGRNHGG
jgi:shikimate kinase